jgi:hypothetical protein
MNLLLEIYNKVFIKESIGVDSITDAIKNKYQVVIKYEGDPAHGIAPGIRTIEAYAYGLTKSGNPVIRAYQPYGDTASKVPNWKFFRLDRIKYWKATYKIFNKPAPGFNPDGDKSMSVAYSIANFNNEPETNVTGPRQMPKKIGNVDNIDKILADREKDKEKNRSYSKTISRFSKPSIAPKVPIKTSDIKEPEVNGIEQTKQQDIETPEIKGEINEPKDKESENSEESIKTNGEKELERMKDLSKRMDNARKIDLNKIPKR